MQPLSHSRKRGETGDGCDGSGGRETNFAEGLPLYFRDHEGQPMPSGGVGWLDGQPRPIGGAIRHRPAAQQSRVGSAPTEPGLLR